MPLVRAQVRNEYALGLPELYNEANREDPKAVLDGVAVAGLVGILRQLGDLAEFAAEVFHGLQEQVMTTASRSHKLRARVQHIEAALPPLEKAVLAQTSHIHFAYTAGSDWHARIRNEQNHFIYNDLPRFIMDSYEECREPPRLQFLDKFDTGGPGSCLKRYSDPTFFKRVSASSDVVNAEKVKRDRKARKIKKKRSWQRNGEVSHGASVSNHSGRMQLFSPNVQGQTSPAQTVSTFDMTLKSDRGDQSNSFGSRTGSGYIECVFNLNSSMQPDEEEPKSSSSTLNMRDNDTLGSVFPDEQTGVVDDDFLRSSLKEQTAPSSSCVTWDEKTEIVEPTGQRSDSDEAPDVLLENFDLNEQATGVVNLKNVDQMDILLDGQNTPKSISDGNELDEIESEPDNYMDALNTIESESENDFDCQTKREVEPYSYNSNNEVIGDGIHELKAHNSDHHPSDFESHTASYSSPTKGVSQNLPDSVSAECFAHGESSQIAGLSSSPDNSAGISFCGSADMFDGLKLESVVSGGSGMLDGSKLESVVSDPLSSGSRILNSEGPTGDKTISNFGESQESLAEFSVTHSVKFWTNGGLLGLEPSKPPDCSVLNAVREDSLDVSKDDTISPSSHTAMPKGDGHLGEVDNLVKNSKSIENNLSSKCSSSGHDNQDVISTKKTSCGFSPADLDTQLEKSGESHEFNKFNDSHGCDMKETSVVTPGTELAVADDVKASSVEASQVNDESSSGVFGLSHRLLVNGFRRNASLVRDDKSGPASSVKTGVFEQKSGNHGVAYQTFPEKTFKGEFDRGSLVNSLSSSPPLEHMKISFHPINGFETSKLKLKFPDGSHCHESTRDMFPSFQLVPEPAILLHDIGSDSDDDTFCRSSPYMSDDCLSHHSDSNSEQWESEEAPGNKDHELYDSLCRSSSMESISSSPEHEGTADGSIHVGCELKSPYAGNGVKPSHSVPSLDLPSFDAVNPLLMQEIKSDSYSKDLIQLQYPKEPTPPPPPPLPPLQWRELKPHLDAAEDKQDAVIEALNNPFDLKPLGSTLSQQTKVAPAKQQQNTKEDISFTPKSKQQDRQKLNGQKEANQAANGKEMDENEDFLHQIRTKSFSLRPTATAKPTFTPGPTTNVKVTAILEKANAIRQAVGSDDGEDDDNWSDT